MKKKKAHRVLRHTFCFPEDKKKILYIDTEQARTIAKKFSTEY